MIFEIHFEIPSVGKNATFGVLIEAKNESHAKSLFEKAAVSGELSKKGKLISYGERAVVKIGLQTIKAKLQRQSEGATILLLIDRSKTDTDLSEETNLIIA